MGTPKILLDSTLGLLTTGYPYFQHHFQKLDTDIMECRLRLEKTICLRGEKAAALFYDTSRFRREGAAPSRFKKTLFGQKGVQGVDGEAHRHRKALFMQCMDPNSIGALREHFEQAWRQTSLHWKHQKNIVLFDEAEEILCRAVCQWMQVPLPGPEVKKRTRQLSDMIDASGAIGPRHYQGRISRAKAELWLEEVVKQVRSGQLQVPGESILYAFSNHRNEEGHLLDREVVAVELLNLIRPAVAIARYIVFAALALHHYPQYRERLQQQEDDLDHHFVQEVRRYYPFFPFATAVVREDFAWNGYFFPKGRRVLLDLYATNRHEAIWNQPEQFDPERFKDWNSNAYNFIPQGGGDHFANHRCAGEWVTIELTKAALNLLAELDYQVPGQDMHINLARIPAIPKSRFVMEVKGNN